MVFGTAAIYGLSLYYAEKIIDKAFIDNGYNGLKGLFMSRQSYKIELNKVIRKTIDEYQQQSTRAEAGKFPFYHSSILFDKLSEYFLFKIDNPKLVEDLFESNPNIFRPTAEELKDFYAMFLDNISKNKKLKKLFIDENYKEEIFNQTDKIYQLLNKSDEILKKVSGLERKLDSIALVRISGKFDSAIQIDGYYRNQGLEIHHKLEKFSPRKLVVDLIIDLLEKNSWVNLFANISMGKSQLAVLVSERFGSRFWIELKDIDGQQMMSVVLSELRSYFSPGDLLIDIKDLINLIPENSIIVLDDLPKLDLTKKDLLFFLDLLNLCKSRSIHILSTSNFNLPGTIKEHYSDFTELDVPFLVQDEVKEVMAAYGSSDLIQNALSKVILNLSFGHPTIVAAINRFMAESNWNVDQGQLESLFAGNYDTGLETDTYEKFLKTVTDEDARAILYRLKLVLGKINNNEISIVADTLPGIQHPHEKVSKLVGLWIQKLKEGSFELNPLVRKINSSLPSNLARDININLGNDILKKKKLNQLDAYRAIWYFLAAEEVNKAGFVLSIVLKSAQENPDLYFDWGFDSFWLNTALPLSMDIYLKAAIRLFQINLLKAKGDSIEYLMADAEVIVKEAATQNVNIAPIALQLTMYFSGKDPIKSNHYLTLVLTQLKELNEEVSFDMVDDIPLNTEMLIWNNLLGVKSEDQFKSWFEVLKQLGGEKIKSSLKGNLHFATSFIFSLRLYDEEKIKEMPNWDGLLSYYDFIISAAQDVKDLFLLPLAVKYKIKILTVHLNDELAAKKVFEDALPLVDGSEIKEFEFILKDEYGRQLSHLGHKDLALPILLEAEAIDTALILTDKIYTYLAINEILIDSNPPQALVFMKKAIRLQEDNPYINDVESAKIYGEYSIVLWQNNKRIEAIYQIEKALDKVVSSYVPEDEYQATIIRLGHVLNYYHHISNDLALPKAQGDDYVKPFAGMFYKPYEGLLSSGFYFEQRKFMQAFLMLQSFEAIKDLEMAKKWARITYRLFDEESYNPFKKVMMRETAYFILDDDFETAISRGFKLMAPNEDQVIQDGVAQLPDIVKDIIKERPKVSFDNADIYLFEYVFLYIIIKILDNYQRNNDQQEFLRSIDALSGITKYFVDPRPVEWIITALEYLADDTKTLDDILGIKHDVQDLSNTITLMLYLVASFKVSVREAFKLHLSLIGRLEMVSTQVAGISNYYFIVIPFIIEFWTKTIKNNPKDFENYSFLIENGLSKVEGEKLDKKLKTLFRVLVHHLNYEPNKDEELWLDS